MIRLDNTTRKLQIILAGVITTNQLPVRVSYSDKIPGPPGSYTGATQLALTNSVTAVDICAAPAASTIRDIDSISVQNADTVAATVTIRYNDNGTLYTEFKATLAVGDQIDYTHGIGWRALDSAGNTKTLLSTPQFAIAAGKTFTVSNTLTLAGTDGTTMTFPSTTATIARTDAANTFTGVQSMTSPDITTSITTPSTTFTAFAGATTLMNFGGTGASASTALPSTLDSTSISTGSLRTAGGLGVTKALWVGGLANIAGATTLQSALTYGGVTLSNAVTGTGNMVLSADSTLTGTTNVAALTASGLIQKNNTAATLSQAFYSTGSTTSAVYMRVDNTGNTSTFGIENSVGGGSASLLPGATAYATVFFNNANVPIEFGINNTLVGRFTSTGLNSTAIGATTASTGAFTTLTSSSATTSSGGSYPAATASTVSLIGGGSPGLVLSSNSGTANNSKSDFIATGSTILGRLISDDNNTQTNWLSVTRSGTTVSTVNFPNGTVGITNGLYPGATQTAAALVSQASSGAGTTTTYIGNQAITTSSDERIKANIVDTQRDAIGIFNKLRVVDHTWNDPTDVSANNRNARGVWTGLLAQQIDPYVPWLVNRPRHEGDEDFTWNVEFDYMAPLFVLGFQQVESRLQQLEERMNNGI